MTRDPMESLTDGTRITGESRMIRENTAPEGVTRDMAEAVINAVLAYIDQTGITRTAIARSLGIGAPTLGSVLSWKYTGAWQSIILDLDRWLEEQQKRDAVPRASVFVWTKVAQEIRTVADIASTLKTIGLVYGPETSGMGKTMALEAIKATKAGSILVSAEHALSTPSALLRAISREMRMSDTGGKEAVYQRIKMALAGTSRLLMIDQIHALCENSRSGDLPLHTLNDLFIATKSPQLWCGTSDIVAHLNRGQAKGQQSLAQIRRRIGICRDLMQRASGNNGEPLYTIDEIRAIFAKGTMRLATDAARYLTDLACIPDSGALGACCNLVVMATKINEGEATILTAAMLKAAHRLLVEDRSLSLLDRKMAERHSMPIAKAG